MDFDRRNFVGMECERENRKTGVAIRIYLQIVSAGLEWENSKSAVARTNGTEFPMR